MKEKIYKLINNYFWELGLNNRFNFYFDNQEVNIDILDQDLNIINSIYLEFETFKQLKTDLYNRLENITHYYY